MKTIAVALLLGLAADAPSPPSNARILPDAIAVPVLFTNETWQAWFVWPDTNTWLAEYSTDGGLSWTNTCSEWAQLPDRSWRQAHPKEIFLGPRMVESAGSNWSVRLRRAQ